ncbi:MarR family winged helix-turn-helix transcriptional regulator [Caldicellulosiruptor morganii]|uniref:MarR family transcriptional regulator n=1 Tax=Caldicellulosiruptor morganii TaxID=1387555 RepID=A0ABY7BNT4_9FIRM|nr:MarR family transcriptional regulator [Caldicellulosiruptor morganii]WAM34190.1 MarR family transcriptional regulator [Caldicellulosiruptor morganii]
MKIKYTSIGRHMLIIDKYFKLFLKNSLKKYGLNAAEGLVLLSLYGQEGRTQEQIVNELHYDKSVMTRIMQSLEKKDYVLRQKNSADSRSYIFLLTDKAKKFKLIFTDILKEWSDLVLEGVDESMLNLADEVLASILKNVRKKVEGKNEE